MKNETSSLLIAAVIDSDGLQSVPSEVHLVKNGVKMTLSQSDWEELDATMKGKRESYFAPILDHEFHSRHTYVFNHPKT